MELADLSQGWWFSATSGLENYSVPKGSVCGCLLQKYFEGAAFTTVPQRVPFGEKHRVRGYPPPPPPPNALTGAGSAKMARKILSRKGLEVKILTTKDLQPFLRWVRVPPPP